MEHTNKNKVYLVSKTIIIVIAIFVLIFTSNLWIGTEENWDEIIKHEFIPALLTRSIFLVMIGLIFLGLSYLADRAFKRRSHFSKELIILIVFSLLLNLVVMLTC
jgi:hypothetical protein